MRQLSRAAERAGVSEAYVVMVQNRNSLRYIEVDEGEHLMLTHEGSRMNMLPEPGCASPPSGEVRARRTHSTSRWNGQVTARSRLVPSGTKEASDSIQTCRAHVSTENLTDKAEPMWGTSRGPRPANMSWAPSPLRCKLTCYSRT